MKREGIHGLIQYLNKTTNNATNTQVAKAIFTNRDKINEISLEKLAGDNYLSQASVSRFIKNQGYKNINEYRWDFIAGQQMLRLNAFNNKKVIISKNNEEIKNDVKQSLQNAFNDIDKLDMTALERLVKIINNYKQVLFIGSEFSLANIYLVQLEMVQYGINAYSYNDPIIMAENLRSLKEDTLIICISTSGQWYNAPSTKEIRDIFLPALHSILMKQSLIISINLAISVMMKLAVISSLLILFQSLEICIFVTSTSSFSF